MEDRAPFIYLLKIKSAESETGGRVVNEETAQLEVHTPCSPPSQVVMALPIDSYTLTFPACRREAYF